MDEEDLLDNEEIEKDISPHPFSFMKFQSLCFFLIIWGVVVGWLAAVSPFQSVFIEYRALAIVLWGVVLLLVAVLASLITVQWNIFIFYLIITLAGLLPVVGFTWYEHSALFIPLYSLTCAIIGFVFIEVYRRSHRYIITNLRIIFLDGLITKQECSLRYDKITAINKKQGVIGRLLGFGTIIPITISAGKSATSGKKKKKKSDDDDADEKRPLGGRNRYELRGVYPYKEVKKTIEKLVQETVLTPYQKEQVTYHKQQVDIQKQMRDLLKTRVDSGSSEEDDEEEEEKPARTKMASKKGNARRIIREETPVDEEEWDSESVDIQRQMRELLKKQEKASKEKTRDDEYKEVT